MLQYQIKSLDWENSDILDIFNFIIHSQSLSIPGYKHIQIFSYIRLPSLVSFYMFTSPSENSRHIKIYIFPFVLLAHNCVFDFPIFFLIIWSLCLGPAHYDYPTHDLSREQDGTNKVLLLGYEKTRLVILFWKRIMDWNYNAYLGQWFGS